MGKTRHTEDNQTWRNTQGRALGGKGRNCDSSKVKNNDVRTTSQHIVVGDVVRHLVHALTEDGSWPSTRPSVHAARQEVVKFELGVLTGQVPRIEIRHHVPEDGSSQRVGHLDQVAMLHPLPSFGTASRTFASRIYFLA